MTSSRANFITRRSFLQATLTQGLALSLLGTNLLMAADAWGATGAISGAASATRPAPGHKPRAPRLLMIDPGHGGHDPGAIGLTGTHEKDVTLDIARRMADALSGQPGVTVKLTRDEDVFLPLEERVKIGRDARADMFLSVHADSAPNTSARGLSVYTLSPKASDEFSKRLADHENEADLMAGMDLPETDKETTSILMDLAARETRNTAQHARASFVESLGRKWRLLDSPMRAANFVVLRAPDVPSMLVETGFLSNAEDEQILRQPQQRDKIARLMARDLATILDSSLFG
jgi:N-acetylmuramoyl-L-alanine amidase